MSKKKTVKGNNMEENNKNSTINNFIDSVESVNDILFIENINLTTLKNMEFENQVYNNDNDNLLEEFTYNSNSNNNDMYTNNSINESNENNDRIKDKFHSYEEWYNNSILCWYCANNFNNKPIFIPKRISNTNLDVYGNFCSFPCSCKYINLHYKGNDNLRSSYINNLKYLYKVFNNKEVNIIPEAPDKEIMKKYGGFMTENEYKEAIKKLKYI